MELPRKIRIGGFDVKVKLEDNLTLTRNHLGEYRPKNHEIVIDSGSNNQQIKETFLHEIIEAIDSIYDFNFQHRDIVILSTVLFQVLRDNDIRI